MSNPAIYSQLNQIPLGLLVLSAMLCAGIFALIALILNSSETK